MACWVNPPRRKRHNNEAFVEERGRKRKQEEEKSENMTEIKLQLGFLEFMREGFVFFCRTLNYLSGFICCNLLGCVFLQRIVGEMQIYLVSFMHAQSCRQWKNTTLSHDALQNSLCHGNDLTFCHTLQR